MHANLIEFYFDGGNGGHLRMEGYGSFLYSGLIDSAGPQRLTYDGSFTSNQAEYETLRCGLARLLIALKVREIEPRKCQLYIYGDSELVIKQLNKIYEVKSEKLRGQYIAVSQMLRNFDQWRAIWHPRAESMRLFGH